MAEVRKTIGKGWAWFEDYYFKWAKYTLTCPADRQVQVGMGVFAFGRPWGEKIRFSGTREILTVGIGSIHCRVTDGRGPCEVVLVPGENDGIPIPLGSVAKSTDTRGASRTESGILVSDFSSIESVSRFNQSLSGNKPLSGLEVVDTKHSLDALEDLSDDLEQQLRLFASERRKLRAQFFGIKDLGSDCDGNSCKTEKRDEPISAGETDRYVHDDQDRGAVSITCVSGDIEVIISTAVWSEFQEFDRKRLTAGQTWKKDVPSMSWMYDQTNRVEVLGHAASSYNLDFASWDD